MKSQDSMDLEVPCSPGLTGIRTVPGDKSISHRAALIAALATGESHLANFPRSADPHSTLTCLRTLGVAVQATGTDLVIRGNGLHGFRQPAIPLDAGNSGTTMRLLAGILAGQPFPATITGDDSLRSRPMRRVVDPLRLMGADIQSTPEGTAPLRISPSHELHAIEYHMPVASAQVKSAILLAGLYARGETTIHERIPTRDHTERMLGLHSRGDKDGTTVVVNGGHQPQPVDLAIPGDPSAAAFLVGAALLVRRSTIRVERVGLNPMRTGFLSVLRGIGGVIEEAVESTAGGEPIGSVMVSSCSLGGQMILQGAEVAGIIDEIPLLAVVAAVSGVSFRVTDAQELRAKECDRIAVMVRNLRAMGLDVEEQEDGFAFEPKNPVFGARIETMHDHRIAMAFAVAGLVVPGIRIDDPGCVSISFPEFWRALGIEAA